VRHQSREFRSVAKRIEQGIPLEEHAQPAADANDLERSRVGVAGSTRIVIA
jgi:hypothetical protein